jgi:LysR family transcriptional regulator, benzoate and cis,cis-muconate-responsive activator of ben and cat genes
VNPEIEVRKMRYFLAVAEERSFTRAAERCHVAQPSLSTQILDMERSLGIRLFDRTSRQVVMTKAGRAFQKEAKLAVEHSLRAALRARAVGRSQNVLRIGISALADFPRFYQIIQKAKTYAKGAELEFKTAYTPDLVSLVLRATVDIAIVDLPSRVKRLRILSMGGEEFAAVMPEKHALIAQPAVSIEALAREPMVLLSTSIDPAQATLDQALRRFGTSGFRTMAAESLPELFDYVILTKRVSLIRSSTMRYHRTEIAYKPILNSPRANLGIAMRSDDRRISAVSMVDAVLAFSSQDRTSGSP